MENDEYSTLLRSEQRFYNENKNFLDNLGEIKKFFNAPGQPTIFCRIIYAWPTKENLNKEHWVESFLDILYNHLTAAGIRVFLDARDHDYYVILVGTESLLQNYNSTENNTEKCILNSLSDRVDKDKIHCGINFLNSLLISGNVETSFDKIYGNFIDAKKLGYVGMIQKLLLILYKSKLKSESKVDFENLLKKFNCSVPFVDEYKFVLDNYLINHPEFISTYADIYGVQYQKPSVNNVFTQRLNIWNQIINYFDPTEIQSERILSLYGLGGSGKSSMAQYYYLNPPAPYSLRAWFNVENRNYLCEQYIELAKIFGIEFNKEMSIENQAINVKSFLEKQNNILLIYDGVCDTEQLDGLVPECPHHHIIITSRNNYSFCIGQRIYIDIMGENEAIELIFEYIGHNSRVKNIKRVKKLVATLGYLPLALAQAGAYIAETYTSVRDYMKLYTKEKSNLLNITNLATGPKHEPVWVTYDKDIKMLKDKCPDALSTIIRASLIDKYFISESSFVNTDDIPTILLWDNVKDIIGQCSLMYFDVENNQIIMNPLLKDIIREKY